MLIENNEDELNEKRVRYVLDSLHNLHERQFYKGDYGAVIELIDLQDAIDKAGLTERQSDAIRLVYEEDLTQAKAARHIGIQQPNVSSYTEAAIRKIAKTYTQQEGATA